MLPPWTSTLEDLVRPEARDAFERQRLALWERLNRCHDTLFLLKRALDPDFLPVIRGEFDTFWRLIVNSCADCAVLLLHGIAEDDGQDVLSMRTFRTRLVRDWSADEHRATVRERLRSLKYDDARRALLAKIREVRHGNVAHLLWPPLSEAPLHARHRFPVDELIGLFGRIEEIWQALHHPAHWIVGEYESLKSPPGQRPDIDRVMDLLAGDTYFVRQPEERGRWWTVDKNHLDARELGLVAKWRARLNLPPP